MHLTVPKDTYLGPFPLDSQLWLTTNFRLTRHLWTKGELVTENRRRLCEPCSGNGGFKRLQDTACNTPKGTLNICVKCRLGLACTCTFICFNMAAKTYTGQIKASGVLITVYQKNRDTYLGPFPLDSQLWLTTNLRLTHFQHICGQKVNLSLKMGVVFVNRALAMAALSVSKIWLATRQKGP